MKSLEKQEVCNSVGGNLFIVIVLMLSSTSSVVVVLFPPQSKLAFVERNVFIYDVFNVTYMWLILTSVFKSLIPTTTEN